MSRRVFLAASAVLGFGRALRAQVARPLRFRPLAQRVVVPMDALAAPWRVRPFVADAVTLPTAATPNQPIRVSGMIVRTSGGDRPESFAAVCVRCPHELCDVDYVDEAGRIPQEVVDQAASPLTEPIYLCPCHNSAFKTDGERIAGPAPRGLYRFRVTGVSAESIEIGEVEEDVLIFV